MPATAPRIVFPDPEEYLGRENDGEWRHEYVNGVIYAMAGGSENHNLIAGNLFANLKLGSPPRCRVFALDMKVQISKEPEQRYYYPDVFVTCSESDRNRHIKSEPILVIEVLSPNTERTDRTEKRDAYKLLPSLMEYVLVEQDRRLVEIYRRRSNWWREVIEPDAPLVLESVGVTLSFDQLYYQVEFSAA
jgi:Uma2 family endonuclease